MGRIAERDLFASALDGGEGAFSVLFVHGPGGIGKSALLGVFAEHATARNTRVVRVDGAMLVATPEAFIEAVGGGLDVPGDGGPIATVDGRRAVVLVDGYEHLGPIDDWVRDGFLPRLPESALTVLAGRAAPAVSWRADTGWRDLLRVVSLRNLDGDEARRYLVDCGVDEASVEQLVAVTYGHPLALTLAADLVARGGAAAVDGWVPDLVAALLGRIIDEVPSVVHRRALEACALARVTTEGLLRDVLAMDDAREVFEWLTGLSFIDVRPDGVVPHDLVRDVLDVDLRWRDRATYDDVFRRVRAHVHGRVRALRGLDQQRAIFDEKFVFRNLPSVLSPVAWDVWGERYPEQAGDVDRAAILELIEVWEGAESAAIAAEWWRRQPEAFFVMRDRGRVDGVLGLITLTGELGFDPAAVAAFRHAERIAAPRQGEVVTQTRFVVDRDRYQAPSPTMNATPVLTMQRYLATPALSWDYLTLHEPDALDDYFAIADLPRAADADFVVGGRRYGLFAHDFRRLPVDDWIEVVTDRALAQDISAAPAAGFEPVVLSQTAFADAVRQALRDLRQPQRLVRNPLCRTRLVTSGDEDDAAVVLARLVDDAAVTLQEHPRDDNRWRAVDRTYLRPAATQERAAEVLGLPFSTYRRHLTEGVARIVELLWERELYGPTGRI